MRPFLTITLFVLASLAAQPAEAQRGRLWRRILAAPRHDKPVANRNFTAPGRIHDSPNYGNNYNPRDQYLRDAYPRYYGGFHVRHLQNVGIPTGDIGIRGNGLYWSPW